MRFIYWFGVAASIALVAYCAWPFLGAREIALAATQGDADALMQRIDLKALRWSLAHQIVREAMIQNGKYQRLSGLARRFAGSVGTTIADAYLEDLLTPENIKALIDRGHVDKSTRDLKPFDMPRLSDVWESAPLHVLVDSYFDAPNGFVVVMGKGEDAYGLHLRLNGTQWRMSGIDLPTKLVAQMASELNARQQKNGEPAAL